MTGVPSVWGRDRVPRLLGPWRDSVRGLDPRVWVVVTLTLLTVAARMSVTAFIGIYFARVIGIPIALVGAALLVENLVRGLVMPVAGALSDRVGRKPVLVWAAGTVALILPAFVFVPGPLSMFAWSIAIGIAQAPFWPAASALLLDLVPPARRQTVLALNYTMIAIGYTIGVAPAGLLLAGGYGVLAAFGFVGFALATLLAVVGLRNLPPTSGAARRVSLLRDLQVAPRDGAFLTLASLALVFPLGIGLLVIAMPVYAADVGLAESTIGFVLAANGPLLALLALPVNARIESRGPYRFLPLAAGILAVSYVVSAGFPGALGLTLAILVFTGAEAIFSAALPTAVAALAPDGLKGAYQGAWGFVFAASAGSGLFLSGLLKPALGWSGVWLAWALLTALAGAGLAFVRPRLRRIADARAAAAAIAGVAGAGDADERNAQAPDMA